MLLHEHNGPQSAVIYPGVRTETFYPRLRPRGDYVLSVGALTVSKGHRFAIGALWPPSAGSRPPLLIAADSRDAAELTGLRSLSHQMEAELAVASCVDDAQVAEPYYQTRVFVYASMRDDLVQASENPLPAEQHYVTEGELSTEIGGLCEASATKRQRQSPDRDVRTESLSSWSDKKVRALQLLDTLA